MMPRKINAAVLGGRRQTAASMTPPDLIAGPLPTSFPCRLPASTRQPRIQPIVSTPILNRVTDFPPHWGTRQRLKALTGLR